MPPAVLATPTTKSKSNRLNHKSQYRLQLSVLQQCYLDAILLVLKGDHNTARSYRSCNEKSDIKVLHVAAVTIPLAVITVATW